MRWEKWPQFDQTWIFRLRNFDYFQKLPIAKNYVQNRVKCRAYVMVFVIDIIENWISLKNYTFFRLFDFAWLLWWKWLRKMFQSRFLELIDHAQRIEQLIHQPKELLNQNGYINDWKRRGFFLIIFNTPFCQWIRPKSIDHIWCKLKK